MTTLRDRGLIPVEMLRCPYRSDHRFRARDLALRDLRFANERDVDTGSGDGNDSWIGLSLAMTVLDSLSGDAREKVGARWQRLLTHHDISPHDATIIYMLRCSLLHGYGLPRPALTFNRRVILTAEPHAYALDTDAPGIARVSVPVFCGRLVERIASEAVDGWDESLIDAKYLG